MRTLVQRTESQEPAAVVTDQQKRLLMCLADPCSKCGLLGPDRRAIQAALDEIHCWRDLDWRRRNYEEGGEIK